MNELKKYHKFLTGKGYMNLKFLDKRFKAQLSDGPVGLRIANDNKTQDFNKEDYKPLTLMPQMSALACSFSLDLVKENAKVLAKECKHENVDILLAPAINIKRHPLNGRNFEYFSEDPVLAGHLAASYINGLEEENVGTSLKHFCCNNIENGRYINDSVVSKRALREIYLKPFEIALNHSNPMTVMTSYNLVNGEYVSESKYLMKDILRGEFNYNGVTVSDWGATNNRNKSIASSLDIEMPEFNRGYKYFKKGLKNHEFSIDDIKDIKTRVDKLGSRLYSTQNSKNPAELNYFDQYQKSVQIASECIVLAKNSADLYPFNQNKDVTVIGYFAQFAKNQGRGSSFVNAAIKKDFLQILDENKVNYKYFAGYNEKGIIESQVDDILENVKKTKQVLLFLGQYDPLDTEGFDRENMKLQEAQVELLKMILKVNKNVGVILETGSVLELDFIDDIRGLFISYPSGEGQNEALFNLVFGHNNPSAKLAETWPKRLEDNKFLLSEDNNLFKTYYDDDVFVGYRYFDTFNIPTNFSFGHGLSYSNFIYNKDSLKILKDDKNGNISISFDIENDSKIDGKEIILGYISKKDSNIYRPLKELKVFKKEFIAANSTKNIVLEFISKDFEIFDEFTNSYVIEKGEYEIIVPTTKEDLVVKVFVDGVYLSKTLLEPLPRTKIADDVKYNLSNQPLEVILNSKYFYRLSKIFKKLLKNYLPDGPSYNDARYVPIRFAHTMYHIPMFVLRYLYKKATK